MIEKDMEELWCTPRLDHLWKTLQKCAGSYQSLQQTHSEITGHFEQLIKVIIAEEHKIKTPINAQMSHIQSTINNIINEIKDINHIINIQYPTTTDNNNSDNDITPLIESITQCKTIDEFTNIITQSDIDTQQQQQQNKVDDDDELLSMIIRHRQHIDQVPYKGTDEMMLQPSRIETNVIVLNGVRKQIESCFKLIQHGSAGIYDGHIMSLTGDQCSVFSLDTFKWTSLDRAFKRSFMISALSIAYARGHIYVFGGPDKKSYSRYSLFDGQCHTAPLPSEDEPFNITTACYDGQKYIYVTGDYVTRENDGVYRLNVLTQECDIYGTLPCHLGFGRANFKADSNSLVIVGEEKIIMFNVETKESNYFYVPSETDPTDAHYIYESCFDGQDDLYLLAADGEIEDDDADRFIRFTLSTKKITKLAMWPKHKKFHRLIYDQSFGIIYMGGRQSKNFQYSIPDDHWSLITDGNLPLKGIIQNGACLIRDH
ncbi:hypothetical protein SAMD00019534_087970 [Acytostelium subglobosum LB1]|uniref:hypothetical protein n=1 Tax=Acytostelium subglobosum LB1 TaxID=1410327 RepID=UPI000644CD25|nr:hypothetical protein SAMD00019534_087970 [Acytostelium subglobosum LB1]GAM25622.1 hypothetical protein SAMD00019534_087970 [Acytostelium subglobosum LB1]|eukprot:XP_012751608.1 hypothetical protein SAMD00019534_087970 [Acytostelium subglobosum LB1]